MNIVYISSFSFPKPEIIGYKLGPYIATKNKNISDISRTLAGIAQDGLSIFIIDVFCCFKEKDKMQGQGGVNIYRNLLKLYEGRQDKLKVVFYSPISRNGLVAMSNGENYVLKHLPFVECNYDGNFGLSLKTILDKNSYSLFNIASENLLSGWSIFKSLISKEQDEVHFVKSYYRTNDNEKARVITFIDDQIKEWTTVFNTIFEEKTSFRFLLYDKSKGALNQFDENKIENITEAVKEADLILSDFYLEETHQSNYWMNTKQLSIKSGFKLFEKIKGTKGESGINKGVPYIMFTSSNKIQYYKFLDANGVDNWLVKDTRTDVTQQEKKENYFTFKIEIEKYTSMPNSEMYVSIRELWDKIEKLEKRPIRSWWDADLRLKKIQIIYLLKNSWMALRSLANKEEYFIENLGSADTNFTPAAIITNMGKILEMYHFGEKYEMNYFFHFLKKIRNASSHYLDYQNIIFIDCLIYFECWLYALELILNRPSDLFKRKNLSIKEYMIQDKGEGKDKTFKYGLLYIYLQYYNSQYSKEIKSVKNRIAIRVYELFANADKTILLDEILNHKMPTYSDKDGKCKIVQEGAIHLSTAIAKNLQNNPMLDISITEEDDKLFITN